MIFGDHILLLYSNDPQKQEKIGYLEEKSSLKKLKLSVKLIDGDCVIINNIFFLKEILNLKLD